MPHILAPALLALWTAGNFYLWAMKQEPLTLFVESLGAGAVAFAALFFYVTRSVR